MLKVKRKDGLCTNLSAALKHYTYMSEHTSHPKTKGPEDERGECVKEEKEREYIDVHTQRQKRP